MCGDSLYRFLRGQVCGDSGRWVAGEIQGPEAHRRLHSRHISGVSASPQTQTSRSPVGTGCPTAPWPCPWGVAKVRRGQISLEGRAQATRCPPPAPAASQKPQGWWFQGGLCPQDPSPGPQRPPHLSLSSLRWSMLSGLRLSARIFFFISRAVCFLPLFWSA